MNRLLTITAIVLLIGLNTFAKDPVPATQPAEPLVGEMRVATIAPMKYLSIDLETSFATMGKDIPPAVNKLVTSMNTAGVRIEGPLVFRYPSIKNMAGKFTLQIGFKVNPDAKTPDGTKLNDLPAFKCATVLFTGPVMEMREAYDAAFDAIREGGLKPAGENREVYLYFETPESNNDVTQIQIGVQ